MHSRPTSNRGPSTADPSASPSLTKLTRGPDTEAQVDTPSLPVSILKIRHKIELTAQATTSDIENGVASVDYDPGHNTNIHQKVDNWLLMIRFERMELVKGPKISISIGDTTIPNIPRRAAMAVSQTLNKHFSTNTTGTNLHFEAGTLRPEAVRMLLVAWLQETCNTFEAEEVPLRYHFRRDISILQAARLLGMEPYTKSIMHHYVDYLYTQMPDDHEMACVEELRTSDRDPVWTKMINNLSHLRHKKRMPDPDRFAEFLKGHPDIARAVDEADAYFKARGQERRERRVRERSKVYDYQTGDEWVLTGEEAAVWRKMW